MRVSGLEGSGRGAVGRCRVRFVGCGNRAAAAGVGGQQAAARMGVGITPDSGKALHEYASRGVSELMGAGRAGQGRASTPVPATDGTAANW